MHLHWDGDNDSVDERNLSAALGAGVTPVTVDHDSLKRVRDWIWTLPPPKYPYPVDQALAARGAPLYQQHCVECHADAHFRDGVKAGSRVGQVEPIEGIGTDRHRLDSYTSVFAANQTGCIRSPSTASRTSGRPTATRISRSTASGCAGPICTTARCRRCATCSIRPTSGRRSSIAATTCSIRQGRLRLERAARRQSGVHAVRHDGARQQQQRTSVRHDAVARREAGDRRIHEDVLKRLAGVPASEV